MSRGKGNAVVILLDVGPSMSKIADGAETSNLMKAVKAVQLLIRNKIFFEPKDEVGLVLFGCGEEDNTQGYKNVAVHSGLKTPGIDLVRFLSNSIIPTVDVEDEADFLEALIVGVQQIVEGTAGKKFAQREILIFTDGGMTFQENSQMRGIVEGFTVNDITIKCVGVGSDDDDEEEDDDASDDDGGGAANASGGGGGDASDNEDSPAKDGASKRLPMPEVDPDAQRNPEKAAEILKWFCQETQGAAYSFGSAIATLAEFQKATVNPTTTYRGPLEIGNLKIGVEAFNRMQTAKPISFKKMSPEVEFGADGQSKSPLATDRQPEQEGQTGVVTSIRSYYLDDDDQTPVEKEDLVKSYRYGNEYVPMDESITAGSKLETEKCLQVLEFVPASTVPRHHFVGQKLTSITHTREDPHAATALDALVMSMFSKGVVALARFVFRKNAEPKLLVLWPHVKRNYTCLLGSALALKQDLRPMTFPPLIANPKLAPTEAQLNAMDSFIDKMDLMEADTEYEEPEEALKPKHVFNPVRQRQMACIEDRAMNPGQPLPSLDPLIKKHAEGCRTEVLERAAEQLMQLETLFPLTHVAKATRAGSGAADGAGGPAGGGGGGLAGKGGNSWAEQSNESAAKRQKTVDAEATDGELSIASLIATKVTSVGDTTPVADYISLCDDKAGDNLVSATKGLQQRINDIVEMFVGGSTHPFASALEEMKKYCILGMEVELFNNFLAELKEKVATNPARKVFWDELKAGGKKNTLISSIECSSSVVSAEAAQAFLEDVVEVATGGSAADDAADSDDDMLDDL